MDDFDEGASSALELLQILHLAALSPENAENSCNNNSGRIIDMLLMSVGVPHIAYSLSHHTTVPWSPHYGNILQLAKYPGNVSGPQICQSIELPIA